MFTVYWGSSVLQVLPPSPYTAPSVCKHCYLSLPWPYVHHDWFLPSDRERQEERESERSQKEAQAVGVEVRAGDTKGGKGFKTCWENYGSSSWSWEIYIWERRFRARVIWNAPFFTQITFYPPEYLSGKNHMVTAKYPLSSPLFFTATVHGRQTFMLRFRSKATEV